MLACSETRLVWHPTHSQSHLLLRIPTPLKFNIYIYIFFNIVYPQCPMPAISVLIYMSMWSGLTGKSHKPLTNAGLHYRRIERLEPQPHYIMSFYPTILRLPKKWVEASVFTQGCPSSLRFKTLKLMNQFHLTQGLHC